MDFSPASRDAFRYGVALAAEDQAKIVLLHVYTPGEFEPFVPISMQEALMNAKQDLALKHFAKVEEELSREFLQKVDLDVRVEVGAVAEQILWTSKEIHADLIVLGRRDGQQLLQRFLGNTATHIIQLAPCPVLIVPESVEFQGFNRIAYGTNFESEDIEAINHVLKIASQHQAKVFCVHVQQKGDSENAFKQSILQEAYQHDLTMHKLYFDTLGHKSISEGLNEYLEENDIDLLVMLTHRRGILSQLFHSSKTKQIALQSKVPILAYQMGNVSQTPEKKKQAAA